MNIPGSVPGMNVLASALTIINPQIVTYYRNIGRATTTIGTYISQYDAPIILEGSWQLVSRELKEKLGLEFNADYIVFYCPWTNIKDVSRDTSGDQLVFNGKQFQCLQAPSDWFETDEWVAMFAVRVELTLTELEKK